MGLIQVNGETLPAYWGKVSNETGDRLQRDTIVVEAFWFPQVDEELCTGCGDCILICPTKALGLVDGLAVLIDPAACTYAGKCEMICPADAVALPYQIVLASGS